MKNKLLKSVKIKAPWTIVYLVDPIAIPGALLLSKIKFIHPNFITLSGFFLTLLATLSFFTGYFIFGAIFYYILLIIDTMDGKVARIKNMTSEFGSRLDSIADKINKFFPLAGILYGYFYRNDIFIAGLLIIFGLHYGIHILYHYLLKIKKPATNKVIADLLEFEQPTIFSKSRIEGFFLPLDEVFFIMIIGPITGLIAEMIIAASIIYMIVAPIEHMRGKDGN